MNRISKFFELGQFWNEKPFWCQPWSILVTGIILIYLFFSIVSNLIFRSLLISTVITWWFLFLIIIPKAYNEILEKKDDSDDTSLKI